MKKDNASPIIRHLISTLKLSHLCKKSLFEFEWNTDTFFSILAIQWIQLIKNMNTIRRNQVTTKFKEKVYNLVKKLFDQDTGFSTIPSSDKYVHQY